MSTKAKIQAGLRLRLGLCFSAIFGFGRQVSDGKHRPKF